MIASRTSLTVIIEEVEYARHDSGPLMARAYIPDGEGPFPGVLDIHGGAWTSGNRLLDEPICQALAESGISCLSIDFRMPPEGAYPASVADVHFAIRWLKENAARFRTSAELIGGAGFSSGGHQLMLCVLRPNDARYAAHQDPFRTDPSLAFVILGYPVTDPTARYAMARKTANRMLIEAHNQFWNDEHEMAEGNPQLILEASVAFLHREDSGDVNSTQECSCYAFEPIAGRRLPPLLIIQGTADSNLTPDMSDRFAAAYRAAGGDVDLRMYDRMPHGFMRDRQAEHWLASIERTRSFVFEHASATRAKD